MKGLGLKEARKSRLHPAPKSGMLKSVNDLDRWIQYPIFVRKFNPKPHTHMDIQITLIPLTREQKQQNFTRNIMKVVRDIERNARFEGAVELKLNIAYNNKANARKPENKAKYTDECNVLFEQLNQYRSKKEAASAKLAEMVEQATKDTENFPEM